MTANSSQQSATERYAALATACEEGDLRGVSAILAEHPGMLHTSHADNDSQGMTLLMYAVQGARTDIVALLLSHGVSTAYRDRQGRTAADWADSLNYASISTLLREEEQRRDLVAQQRENARQVTEFAAQFTEGLGNPVKIRATPFRLRK